MQTRWITLRSCVSPITMAKPSNPYPMKRGPLTALHLIVTLLTISPSQKSWAFFPAGSNNFASATVIPPDETVSSNTNLTAFTEEQDEPIHHPQFSMHGGKTAWWAWTATDDGYCTVDTLRSISSTNGISASYLSVYTGNALNNLTRIAGGGSHSSYELTVNGDLSQVSFLAIKGTQYKIAIDVPNSGDVNATRYIAQLQLRLLPLKKTSRLTIFSFDTQADTLGSLKMDMTSKGSLSGRFQLGRKTYPFSGRFDRTGYFQTVIIRKDTPEGLPISLLIDGTGEGYASITWGSQYQSASAFPRRIFFDSNSPNSTTGRYTAYAKHSNGTNPGGMGTYCLKINAKGTVTGAGRASDGTPITFSSVLCETILANRYYIIAYRSLLKGKAAFILAGFIFETGADDRISAGAGLYVRAPSPTSTFYPTGILHGFDFIGSTYRKPATNNRALAFLNPSGDGTFKVTDSGGELTGGDLVEPLNLSPTNKFTFTSPTNKPVLKLNLATGFVTGSITIAPEKKRTLIGVLTRENTTPLIRGYSTGTTTNLSLEVD